MGVIMLTTSASIKYNATHYKLLQTDLTKGNEIWKETASEELNIIIEFNTDKTFYKVDVFKIGSLLYFVNSYVDVRENDGALSMAISCTDMEGKPCVIILATSNVKNYTLSIMYDQYCRFYEMHSISDNFDFLKKFDGKYPSEVGLLISLF